MEQGATGDISIGILRRNGSITVPVYLWLGGAWVDLAALTAAQWNTYVTARLAATTNPQATLDANANQVKVDGLTITRTQF
jgi:hypothetical protein